MDQEAQSLGDHEAAGLQAAICSNAELTATECRGDTPANRMPVPPPLPVAYYGLVAFCVLMVVLLVIDIVATNLPQIEGVLSK